MLERIRLYLNLISVSMRSQMQYRASFLILVASYFLSTFVDILGIWVLFDRFHMIKGWTLQELALVYGVIQMGFALAEASARGFDSFSQIVKSGEFDRLLLRPCGTLVQVASRDFQMLRMGRFFQGFLVLWWGCTKLGFSLFSLKGPIILLAILGTSSLFYALFIIQATLAFWTTETLEIMNIATYGGLESGQYPMSIYNRGFRLFLTFIIPLACVACYPMATLLQHESFPLWVAAIFPFVGFTFLLAACHLWKLGVRHYHSAGS